ncbi:hypothetical protein ACOMHN_006537 [Nucella lapillus]
MLDISSGHQELGEMLHEDLGDASLNAVQKLLEDLLAGRMSSADVACDEALTAVSEKLEQQKEELAHKRTSALWLQYMKMVDILKSSIKAERTGNFDLHLQSSSAKVWDIQAVQSVLGEDVCKHILFAHAIGGCDTVSSLFSIGKSIPFKKVMESADFREQTDVFIQPPVSDTKDKVTDAGQKVLVDGGKQGDMLNTLRYVKYMQKLSTSSSAFQPSKLPPTAAAAKFHCFRTYFQVQQWMKLQEDTFQLNAEDWGWEVTGGMLLPILTDIAAASENLLNDIRCNCKTDCQSACCSCRKHGLVCTSACGECRGESCANALSNFIYLGDDDETDDE